MFVPIETLPDSSRVWVYTSEKPFTNEQKSHISQKLPVFLENWQSHQLDVRSSFQIAEDRFLVIAVDESYNGISGCGIDKSLHLVQELESDLGISLTGKTNVLFEKEGQLLNVNFNKIKEKAMEGVLNSNDYFFNTLVSDLGEFRKHFKIKAAEGWIKKYFTVTYSN